MTLIQMIMKQMGKFVLGIQVIFMILISMELSASHVSGGSIKYKSLGSGRYYIEVAVFRDCSGVQYSAGTARITATCTATSTTANYTLNLLTFVAPVPAPYGGPYSAISFTSGSTNFVIEEVSDVCDKVLNPSRSPNTRCRTNTSRIQGYTRFKYSGIITLASCNYWKLGFVPQCCRNTSNANITSGAMYIETRFDSRNFPNNSAPDFADEVKPIPSACVGKEVKYGIGTVDADGDSLRFDINCAMQSSTTCVTYRSGFSATAPAPGILLDSATGLIRFTPKNTGKRVVAFWVKEYERCTGKWKAQTLRDVQFRIESCNNNIPKDISGVSNVQNALRLDSFGIQVCNGMIMSFEDTIFDKDITDTLVFKTNVRRVLPGSKITITNLKRNKAVVRFTWRASIGKNPVKIFYLVYNDDKCDYPGNGFSVFRIEVRNSTNAGSDIPICAGDTAYIVASGGRKYEWKSVYGDSLIWTGPNKNVWGDSSRNDTNRLLKFLPKKTTFLEVWSDLSQGCVRASACQDKDSVKIIVAKNFNLDKHNDTIICFNDSAIGIWAKPDSTHSTFYYKWEPSAFMNSDSIYNPKVTPIEDKYYHITVTSDSGCVRQDSILVQLTPPFPPNIEALASDTFVCQGTKSFLDLNLGYVPTKCGLSKHQCVGSAINKQIGKDTTANLSSGTNSALVWPSPYGNIQASARMQFLFTSAELSGAGISAGLINGLSFNIKSLVGTKTYSNFTIRIKCVSYSQLSQWELRASQVHNPKNVTIGNGWNYHKFDTPYDYDGTMNLLVEVCFSNTSSTSSSSVFYTATTFNSCLGTFGAQNQCSSQSLQNYSRVNRPNIKFEFCKGPNPGAYNYKWVPSKYLSSDSIKNPTATILDSISYYALVTDTFGKCSGYSSVVKINLSKIEIGKDTALCPYDTVRINVNAKSKCSGPKTYKWIASDTLAYISNDTIANPYFMATKKTAFELTYTDTCGCTIVDTFNILMRILPDPVITRKTPSCGLDNGSLTISGLGGVSPYNYTVTNLLSSQKDSNISGVFNKLNNGYFDIKVTDAGKCFVIIKDTFTNTAPIIDSISIKNLRCFKEADGKIDIYASQGIPPLSYSIDSGTTWLTSSQFNNLSAGKYKAQARSVDGCVTKPIDLRLTESDSLFADIYYTEVSCNGAGDAVSIAVSHGGTQPYKFNWGNGGIRDTIIGLSGGRDSLVLLDDSNCKYVRVFDIIEFPAIVIDSVNYSKVTCNGYDDGKINVYARGGKQALFYSVNQGGTYTSFNAFNGLKPQGYGVRVKDVNGCVAKDTVSVVEPKEVEIFSNIDSIKICVSNCTQVIVNARGGNRSQYSYHWTPGITDSSSSQRICPNEDSKYWVYAKDIVGCISVRKEVEILLYDSLNVTVPAVQEICKGQSIELPTGAKGGDGSGYNYLWYPALNVDNPNFWKPLVSPDSTTTFSAVLSDNCGSPYDTSTVKVKVLSLPEIDFEADTTFACTPGKIIFKNKSKSVAVSCFWDLGDGLTWDGCGDAPYLYRRSGKYDVMLTITDTKGCMDSLAKENYIEIARNPIAYFTIDPENPTILNPEVQFYDKSKGIINKWSWNFSGFEASSKQNPKFTFPESTKDKYMVKLEVTDTNTCVGDTLIAVFVGPEFSFYVPSAFTPNGDGLNDVWKPVGSGLNGAKYEMIVFDRWGQLVFKTNDLEIGWGGKNMNNGEFVPAGIYPYKFRIGDIFDEKAEHVFEGSVTVVGFQKEKK